MPAVGKHERGLRRLLPEGVPAIPSSITFTVLDSVNLSAGPTVFAASVAGTGVFITPTTANANTRFYTSVFAS